MRGTHSLRCTKCQNTIGAHERFVWVMPNGTVIQGIRLAATHHAAELTAGPGKPWHLNCYSAFQRKHSAA